MPDIDLSQAEVEALIAMEKECVSNNAWDYPSLGGSISIPLCSTDKRESFFLDISRGQIALFKAKYQNRARQVVVLLRLDAGGPPHRNPDGNEIPCPHLHVYREAYGDRWAIAVPPEQFENATDLWQTLVDFMRYCHIIKLPIIQKGLFP